MPLSSAAANSKLLAVVFLASSLIGCVTTSTSGTTAGLVGKIYDTRKAVFLSDRQYVGVIKEADFLLLGEIHDNPTHHKLQAEALKELQTTSSKIKLYFEHLSTNQNDKIKEFNQNEIDIDRISTELAWDKSGWPAFKIFRPLFEQARKNNTEIAAALFPKDKIKSLYRDGMKAVIDQAILDTHNLEVIPDVSKEKLLDDIVASHCGMVTREKGEPMVKVQMGKDAFIALQLIETVDKKVVLVAGNGHTRNDYGVPLYLKKLSPNKNVVSVAMIEVTDPNEPIQNYMLANPADILVFTAPWPRSDPCEEMRKFIKK